MTNSKNDSETQKEVQLVSPYKIQRTIGYLGILLPVLVAIGAIIVDNCDGILRSVSAYYHAKYTGAVFVGVLGAMALCFYAYKGYEPEKGEKLSDDLAGTIVCILASLVALFPTNTNPLEICIPIVNDKIIGGIHLGAAILMFGMLAYFCLCKFTKTRKDEAVEAKSKKWHRNRIYRWCGWIIIGSMALIGIIWILGLELDHLRPVFVLEVVMLFAFGLSWLTKGGMLFKD